MPNVRSDCACVAAAPLGWPVVPDVKMRSERSSGRTAAARAAETGGIDALARLQEVVQACHGQVPGVSGDGPSPPPSSRRRTTRVRSPVSSPASMAG